MSADGRWDLTRRLKGQDHYFNISVHFVPLFSMAQPPDVCGTEINSKDKSDRWSSRAWRHWLDWPITLQGPNNPAHINNLQPGVSRHKCL